MSDDYFIFTNIIVGNKFVANNYVGNKFQMKGFKMMKRGKGNWVAGDDFWDRKEEMALFLDYLKESSNLLLIAPRRTGKTSLMRRAIELIGDSSLCLFVDFEKCYTAEDAITELSLATQPHQKLWGKTKAVFKNILEAVESIDVSEIAISLRSGLNAGNWQRKGDDLFTVLEKADKPVIVFCDEVPTLVNRILKGDDFTITPERRRNADAFMSWLRAASLKHKGKIALVVTGSIGIEPILQQAGLSSTINHFTTFTLGPWTPEISSEFLTTVAATYQIDMPQAVALRIPELLGYCIPHHVQLFFETIYQTCRLKGIQTVTVELVETVYHMEMQSTVRSHPELSHMEERLKLVLGPVACETAYEFLTETAVTGKLTAETAVFLAQVRQPERGLALRETREILSVLEHDGYLQRNRNEYEFLSQLLRDWWKTRFEFGFQTVAERKNQL